MAIAVQAKPLDLTSEMQTFIGRHTDKSFDWDAFPGSRGFPELERAQMRYIGAGGSPKADDPSTLTPGQFTLSLVHQPVGKYAACHSHEVVEHFLVLKGVLTIGWAWDDEVIEARLGPKDMVLNQVSRPHGFRNDGVEPVLMSISVGSGMPKPPVYVCHPRDSDPSVARRFGATPGKTHAFDPASKRSAPEAALASVAAGLKVVEKTGGAPLEAELYRLKGEALLAGAGPPSEAEAALQQGIAVARRQNAKSWELRAATSLARLRRQQGRPQEAAALLAPILGWFTEGLDTADLKEAKTLLDTLTEPAIAAEG